jgi:hypothetical protein
MKLGNANPQLIDFDPYNVSTIGTMEFGAHLDVSDGRAFRYAKAGTVGPIAVGKIATAPAEKLNHQNLAIAVAASAGVNTITLTLGATTSVLQEYSEGRVSINSGPGAGQTYKISDQQFAAASTNQLVTIFDPISIPLTTVSTGTLSHNAYNGTLNVASQVTRITGVPLVNVPASAFLVNQGFVSGQSFYWGQTKGIATILGDGAGSTIPLGSRLVSSGSVVGAVAAESTTATVSVLTTQAGVASIMAMSDTKYSPVFLSVE